MRPYVALLLAVVLSGCATIETWNGLAQTQVHVRDVDVVCSNDVVCAVKVHGEQFVPIVPSALIHWDDDFVEQFDVDATHSCRVIARANDSGADGLSTNGLPRLVELSQIQWTDDDFVAREVLKGRCARDFAIVIADLNQWRKYLAVPVRRNDLPSGYEEWAFAVLQEPVIGFNTGRYVSRECGFRVIASRILLVPPAFAVDLLTLPFQVCLGLFAHP